MDTAAPPTVNLLGRTHHVTLPDFAAREELVVAYADVEKRGAVPLRRVYAAMLGLCTRLGRESGADYQRSRFDVLAYGGDVWTWLSQQGAEPKDVATAARVIHVALLEAMFPRRKDVEAALGNSEGGADN